MRNSVTCRSYNCCRYRIRGKTQMKWKKNVFSKPLRRKMWRLMSILEYVGRSKLRYRNHVSSFRNERYKHATELSKCIWSLKDKNAKYNIKWRKIKQASSYSNVTKRCNLCLWEKYFIICKPEMASLNKRNELSSCCRHVRKFLLKNVTM